MFNLAAIGLYIALSGIAGNSTPMLPVTTGQSGAAQVQLEVGKEDESKEMSTEAYVRNYFSDIPILAEIASCESHFRQTDKNGRVMRGGHNKYDVGVMQINELYHQKKAEELGYDIYNIDGNLGYARYLYEKEGARPWMASSGCWAKFKELAMR